MLLIVSYTIMIAFYAYAFGGYGASVIGGGRFLFHLLVSIVIVAFTLVNALGGLVSGRIEYALVGVKLIILFLVILVAPDLLS